MHELIFTIPSVIQISSMSSIQLRLKLGKPRKKLNEVMTYLDGHICKQQTPREFHEFYITSSETHEQCFRASVVVEKTIVGHNDIKHKSHDTYVFDITDPPKVHYFIIHSSLHYCIDKFVFKYNFCY